MVAFVGLSGPASTPAIQAVTAAVSDTLAPEPTAVATPVPTPADAAVPVAADAGSAATPAATTGQPAVAAATTPAATTGATVEAQFTTNLPDLRAAAAIKTALAQIGLPYVWGGNGPTAGHAGFDCSGLTTFSYASAGREAAAHGAHPVLRGPARPAGRPAAAR